MQGKDLSGIHIEGHIKIHCPTSGEIYVNKRNAIHYENMSISLAESIANAGQGLSTKWHSATVEQQLIQQAL